MGERIARWALHTQYGQTQLGWQPAICTELENRGVEILHQTHPNGLVDAVRCARSLTGDSPCLVALPDVLFADNNPSVVLCDEFDGSTRLAVVQTASPWGEYLCDTGRVTELEGGRILGISEKHPDRPFPLGEFRVTGRAIWTKAFWDVAEDNEVDALRRLIENGILSASFVKTTYIDVGLTVGYEYAQSIFN